MEKLATWEQLEGSFIRSEDLIKNHKERLIRPVRGCKRRSIKVFIRNVFIIILVLTLITFS